MAADGTRVLTMRYWPRGIRKEKVDVWLRELAPVIPLLRAYLDGADHVGAVHVRATGRGCGGPRPRPRWPRCGRSRGKGPVTLLCGCADPARCHRTLLRAHLLDSGR